MAPCSDQRARLLGIHKKKITQTFPGILQSKFFMDPSCVETLQIVSLLSYII